MKWARILTAWSQEAKKDFSITGVRRGPTRDGLIFSNADLATHEAAGNKVLLNRETADARYVQGLTAGTNITIDNTDPANPVINSTGGGSSGPDFIVAYKTAQTPRNSTTTSTPDPDLVLTLEANSIYQIECFIVYSSQGTPDFKSSFSIPAGATGYRAYNTSASAEPLLAWTANKNDYGYGTSTPRAITHFGTITTDVSGGHFLF